ncbi:MAG: hypothetical protein ABIO99_10460 [Candidatus Limnocylindria bacterium]
MSFPGSSTASARSFGARLIPALAASLLLLATAVPALGAGPKSVGVKQNVPIHHAGSGTLKAAAGSASAGSGADEFRPEPQGDGEDPQVSGSKSVAHVPSAGVPRPPTTTVQSAPAGFAGLNHYDQRVAGSGAFTNTQFSLEPPDQALCVGGGKILESVNTALRVRTTGGANATSAVPLNQFFGLTPEINRATGVYGDFTSDPKCYYDAPTQRWFVTLLQADIDPPTGAFTGRTSVLIAVSQTADPAGAYSFYKIDTTNDGANGTPSHAGCPCLGDQPLIGADANGFYISTNEFPLFADGFNGTMIYAMSKTALAAGGGTLPTVVSFFEPILAEGYAYSVQPATTPPGAAYASEGNGTEYFLSALDFNGNTDNRIAVWALSNTASLATASPSVTLTNHVIASETYGQPPAVIQKDGPTPLRDLLKSKISVQIGLLGKPSSERLTLLNSNDDRMNQTVYANGQIWGAVNTVVKSPTGPTRTGIAYFIVNAASATMARQGYVSVDTDSVMFPAVAVNASGAGVMSFTLAGPNTYPSAAYVRLNAASGHGPVQVAKAGVGPADGFTGYISLVGGNVERWGDYGAAVADESGTIWFAAESINQACDLNTFLNTGFTCGNTRTIYANWGTWIAGVTP